MELKTIKVRRSCKVRGGSATGRKREGSGWAFGARAPRRPSKTVRWIDTNLGRRQMNLTTATDDVLLHAASSITAANEPSPVIAAGDVLFRLGHVKLLIRNGAIRYDAIRFGAVGV